MQKNNAKRIIEHFDAATHERLTKCDNITEVQKVKILEGGKNKCRNTVRTRVPAAARVLTPGTIACYVLVLSTTSRHRQSTQLA